MADIFSVIADATRREILGVLLDRRSTTGEASVSEIVEALGVAQPTVSKHLKTLRDVGLVEVREEGQHRFYRIDTAPLDEVDDWLMPFVFAGDDQAQEGGLGAAAFAAWAGANVSFKSAAEQARTAAEQALDRANAMVDNPAPVGESLGRRVADAAHEARQKAAELQSWLDELQDRIDDRRGDASRAIEQARDRLRRRD
ncbi:MULTISPECIES: ArsR/SmtB family transcription factor [unclassified Agrococcus]|uniref:ArsR/SmtB family transcription factor n=1 Tax=unclassified Agrococcus TaxID=2615065 RepID=UPI003607F816